MSQMHGLAGINFEGIGDGKFAMAEYGKVKRFTFPLNYNHIIYITTEPEVDHGSFVKDVLKIKDSSSGTIS